MLRLVQLAFGSCLLLGAFGCTRWHCDPPRLTDVDDLNVVVVLVDAMRADHLGCYGGGAETTPAMDRLAQHGLRFANAYSNASGTVESTASLFTSTLPPVHRISAEAAERNRQRRLSNEYLLLTEAFSAGALHTGLLTTQGWVSSAANYMQGVDERVEAARDDAQLVAEAKAFFERNRDRRFFLYVHMIDLHDYFHPDHLFAELGRSGLEVSDAILAMRDMTPRQVFVWLASEARQPGRLTATDVELLEQAYDALLVQTDRHIGELAASLEELGLDDRTLLVVTADHGERFGEHGWFVHSGSFYFREVVHIPFIVSCPGRFSGPTVATTPISSIDFGPTLLDLAGIETPSQAQGESLADRLDEDRTVFTTDGTIWRATRRDWSFLTTLADSWPDHLYNLADDPGETQNLAAEQEQRRSDMRAEVEAMARACAEHEYRAIDVDEAAIGDDQHEALKALGYVD